MGLSRNLIKLPDRRSSIRCVSAVLSTLTFVVTGFAAIWGYSRTPGSNVVLAVQQRTRLREHVEVEQIRILPTGFEPGGIVRPAGRFILALNNESGLRQLVVRFDREDASRVAEIRIGRKTEFTRILDLPPGLYRISETNHPDWIMTIRVTAR